MHKPLHSRVLNTMLHYNENMPKKHEQMRGDVASSHALSTVRCGPYEIVALQRKQLNKNRTLVMRYQEVEPIRKETGCPLEAFSHC